jgi:hypothetical protein
MTLARHFPALMLMLLLTTAGGLGGCAILKDESPEIANLVYIPAETPVRQGGTATVIGTFNIVQARAKSATVNAVVFDAQGKKISETPLHLDDASLQTSDTLAFGAEISISVKGNYMFQVYIVDEKGRQSNRLAGSFAVTDLF